MVNKSKNLWKESRKYFFLLLIWSKRISEMKEISRYSVPPTGNVEVRSEGTTRLVDQLRTLGRRNGIFGKTYPLNKATWICIWTGTTANISTDNDAAGWLAVFIENRSKETQYKRKRFLENLIRASCESRS
jgi:hypothetical protein